MYRETKQKICLGIAVLIPFLGSMSLDVSASKRYQQDMRQLGKESRLVRHIVNKVKPSIVTIQIHKVNHGVGRGFYQDPLRDESSYLPNSLNEDPYAIEFGTGILISKEGHVITRYQHVQQAESIRVILPDNKQVKARTLGIDPWSDIALLKVEDTDGIDPITFGESNGMRLGDWVLSIGKGIGGAVAGSIGTIVAKPSTHLGPLFQTDAVVNRDNAGGALVDLRGELIGMTSLFFSSDASTGFGGAIPVRYIRRVIQDLKAYGYVKRGWIGMRYHEDKEGRWLWVSQVIKGSPADNAGIVHGDKLIAFDNVPVYKAPILHGLIAESKIKSVHKLTILRQGVSHLLTVQIQSGLQDIEAGSPENYDIVGLALEERIGDESELWVASIAQNSVADKSGFEAGDRIVKINEWPVHTLEAYESFLAEQSLGTSFSVLLQRNGEPVHITFILE